MTIFTPFDVVDHLDDEETISAYLSEALADPDPAMFLLAIKDVARARGMTQLAKDSGLGRESLYKALAPGSKPRYETIMKLLHGLGIKLNATPAA
ncbi:MULTISPECIES: addiction module antidote protein [Iodobacter]|uniref:Addiction module antidote protein n=1 Tax=Iodobacter fluviatilis TaxID=537 RepID=A0A377Q3W3_9NEIS|nr:MULTISPECIES: addiction module antidote protein [Iodobacter]MDW5417452.1 putative addiction module antidote protein [Iodobacter sp. CM08]TCU90252.1 putative addiction module antidote protein [Iodobacter fluviatilis]STQ89279.1 Predicted transcriptional regulator [Iodobacter fluviatilis]